MDENENRLFNNFYFFKNLYIMKRNGSKSFLISGINKSIVVYSF